MDISKLFETQKILRDRIGYNEPDRFNKLILALLVELGECANEVRCFKFWSHKPASEKSVILEEYVDGLHFILEIGLEIHCKPYEHIKRITLFDHLNNKFNAIFKMVSNLELIFLLIDDTDYQVLLTEYIELGGQLGFTWEEIEQAYFAKNKINHQRQESGY